MQRILFLMVYPVLWGISKLPYRLFYAVSDFAFFVVYYLIGYRKKVVYNNLKQAFPHKPDAEIKQIRKKFYHHFCDLFLEMTKSFTITAQELKRRFVLKNPEELKRIEKQGRSYIVMLGHYNSYEWITSLALYGMTYKSYGIYKSLKNKYFDRLIRHSRGRFGTHMLDKNEAVRQMIRDRQEGILAIYGMIADQAPARGKSKYWRSFMNREVPVFVGSEVTAKKLNYTVVYLKIEKVKRGFYEAQFITIADHPREFEDFAITDRYFELLEEQIRFQPQYYLWTHRRWKHVGMKNKT